MGGRGRDALEGLGTQRRPQKRLDRRLEEAAKAVGVGYCRLQMPLTLALGVRGTVAGHRLGALAYLPSHRGYHPPFQCIPGEGREWTQKFVTQKCPNKIVPMVTFILSDRDNFGLEGPPILILPSAGGPDIQGVVHQ